MGANRQQRRAAERRRSGTQGANSGVQVEPAIKAPLIRRVPVWLAVLAWFIFMVAVVADEIPGIPDWNVQENDAERLGLILIAFMAAASWKLGVSRGFEREAGVCRCCVVLFGILIGLAWFDPTGADPQIQLAMVLSGLWLLFAVYAFTCELRSYLWWLFGIGSALIGLVVFGLVYPPGFAWLAAQLGFDPVNMIKFMYIAGMFTVNVVFLGRWYNPVPETRP